LPWGYAAAAVGTYLGSREAGRGAESAARTEADAMNRALDYQQEVERLPLEIRNQFLPLMSDFYSGGEGQNQFIEDTKSSPFYQQMIQAGQEGVLANAGARGLTRSGNTAQDLSLSNQNVLNSLVNQRLAGVSTLANQPLNTNAIANSMSGIGRTMGQGQIAQANAMQQGYGGMFDAIIQGTNEYNRSGG
jgi:hypothetical protein